ncbi:glycerol-3-phosphate dehydrogenase [Rhizobium anhuiense]|uniref:FAD-binding oxidoreductase n=1 Tax=Rhizobium anhuiense TaxID=1184720 RepID=A0A3S0SVB7_9HYPH|nr:MULTISPECIES: FAD-binding oxidoreductase [Rhizobium]NKM53619.1 FAD-dependent oxidoreductase [Rhizobium anhuiense]PDS66069.1 glycerol-3-phosphate dehydrogenase [Rhizobium anhuiense]RUM04828.1 FAD-binding oxidoreductase [Rhizobium anhuiense]GGD68555.1 glycerol-3-phosphate dehydrogenase [Rhizobium anhuiense]
MAEHFDIAIIGGGIVGAALAHTIGNRRSVVLLEREEAWGYHSTGRSAAEFSLRFQSEGAGRLIRASAGFLQTPPDGFCDLPLIRPRGNLCIAQAEKAGHLHHIFEAERNKSAPMARPLQLLTVADALALVPFLDPDWVAAALYDPDCWDIEVDSLLQSYLKSARHAGADLRRNAEVTGARMEGSAWRLETNGADLLATTVVNAAGGWADPVALHFGATPLGLVPYRRTAITVPVEGYDVSAMPEINEIDEDFYFKPDAGRLLVSPADETPVTPHDAWPEELDIAQAAQYLSDCTKLEIHRISHSWAGLRTFAPDRLPVIGASKRAPGFFWLAGLGGFGIQSSPAVAALASSLLLETPIPAALRQEGITAETFSPIRFE